MIELRRIGTHRRVTAERYVSEAPAVAALRKQAERKRRHGYTDQPALSND